MDLRTFKVVLLLLAVGLARATGDGDESCSPEYPINVNVLLDSSTARWIAQSSQGILCGGNSVSVCDNVPDDMKLKTHSIYKHFNTYPVRIFINITYSFMECQMANCVGDLELQTASEHYNVYDGDSIMPDNHVQNTKGASSGTKQFFFDSEPWIYQFSLALISRNSCVNVSRVLVYRYECPGHDRLPTTDLLHRRATPAPVSGSVVARSNNAEFCDVTIPYKTLMCTSQGVWLVCEGAENEFICKESKSNLTDMTSTIPSSPTPSPAAVEDCGCEPPTALLAIVAVLIVAICGLILLVVIFIVALARTNRKLKPSPKESSNDGELSNPVYDPLACNVTSTARVTTTNDNGTTDQDDDQKLHHFSNILYDTPQVLSNNTSAVS
jgi:hypothetical protein